MVFVVGASLALSALTSAMGQDDPPNPIIPNTGEAQLLDIINSLPVNEIERAKDNFPVPYVVVASAAGAAPTIKNNRAGAPTRIDADRSLATGRGGHDIEVEVNTELLPTPHLRLNVNRLGIAPFAEDLSVVVAFPFDAFNSEDASDGGNEPNLFFGYQTTAAFDAVSGEYPTGGIAPLSMEYRFIPEFLAGTEHLFEMRMTTTGATNPLRYIGGHFDGNAAMGIQDAIGIAAHADPVPNVASLTFDVAESATDSDPSATTDSSISLGWTATVPTKLTFDYLENESFPFVVPEYNTTLTFDKMPTQETLTLSIDEDDPSAGLTLAHDANAVIDKITLLKERSDGLTVTGVAAQVPTHVALTTDLDGSYELDVNANTLDLTLHASQVGGFIDTSDMLGYDVGTLSVELVDVPDLAVKFDPDTDRYEAKAVNPGESIGSASLVLDDGPVRVVDGRLDVDNDGDVDADDDGVFGLHPVIDGRLDLDGSTSISSPEDDGAIAGSLPSVSAFAGEIDLNASGAADGFDDGYATGLALAPAWTEEPTHHVLSLVDDGTTGTLAGRLVKLSTGSLDLDGTPVVDGQLDVNGDGVADGNDDGTLALDLGVIDGAIDSNADGAITAADSGPIYTTFGPKLTSGLVDINGDGVVNADDDGTLSMQTYQIGTTGAAPLQAFLRTEPTSTLIPAEISATCTVKDIPAAVTTFRLTFPPPSFGFGYKIDPPSGGIDEVTCVGHFGTLLVETTFLDLPDVFAWDFDPDEHLTVTAEDGTGPNTATLGSADIHICEDTDLDGTCEETDIGGGVPGTGDLLGKPIRDARARLDQTPSFDGQWRDGSVTVANGLVTPASGSFAGLLISGGQVDVNDDGAVNTADDGHFLGKRVVNGAIDVDGDGDVDADDDGTVSGTAASYDTGLPDASMFLDGVQVDVATKGGLAPLPVASASADDYARLVDEGGSDGLLRFSAGVFGVDEFRFSTSDGDRTLALHYGANEAHRLIADVDSTFGGRFFPDYAVDLTLDIQKVPATFDLFTDLATELTYNGSAAITSVDLTGTIDDTNDSNNNGTVVNAQIDQLPKQLALHLAADVVPVVDGRIDVNGGGISASDDAVRAGVRIIDGELDLNGDGAANTSDDGDYLGVPVIDGRLDVNEQGGVTNADDGALAGGTLKMNDKVDLVDIQLSSNNKVIGTDYRLLRATLDDIPAQWAVNWGGGRFLLETKNAAGAASPLTQASFVASTSNDATENANRLNPFTLDGPALSGPVLDAASGPSTGCRVNYSAYTQEIDKRYYNAAAASDATDPSAVFDRLEDLYCDSEQLDAGEDHLVVRMGNVGGSNAADYVSLQFSGFQKLSIVPDANGGHISVKVPTAGLHPIFIGFEDADVFTTVQVGNIPDSVEIEIDKSEQVTYDASDDTDASFGEIDIYSGPLPIAQDNESATRVIVQPLGTDATPTTTHIHAGWKAGFPSGGVYLDNERELEILLLTQDGSNRITAGLDFEDLLAGYALDLFSFDVQDTLCILPDLWGGCIIEIPVAWELFEAKAGITNDADNFTPADLTTMTPDTLSPNPAKPDMAGFLAIYSRLGSPSDLTGPALAAGGAQYVPLITAEEENFRGASASLRINLDPLSPDILVFSIDVDFQITGSLVFDFWSHENIDFTDDDAIPFIPEVGFVDQPSYTNNSPFHIVPGVQNPISNADFDNVRGWVYTFNGWHGYGSHFDPHK